MESTKELVTKYTRFAEERNARYLREAAKHIDTLKAERNSAEHDLSMHKETCLHCAKKTTEELAAGFGCDLGAVLARVYQQKSRQLRGAE